MDQTPMVSRYFGLLNSTLNDPGPQNQAMTVEGRKKLCSERQVPCANPGDIAYSFVNYSEGTEFNQFIAEVVRLTLSQLAGRPPKFKYPGRPNVKPPAEKTALFELISEIAKPGELRDRFEAIRSMEPPEARENPLRIFISENLPNEEEMLQAIEALVVAGHQDPLANDINVSVTKYEAFLFVPC